MGQIEQPNTPHNILIVDDDQDTCRLLELLFHREGYRTTVAYGGPQALQRVEVSPPDLVLLDVMMPEMDGWETFRRLRNLCTVPVIFLTAMTSGESAALALQLGVDDYVRKPYSAPELLARVEALIGRNRSSVVELERDIASDGSSTMDVLYPSWRVSTKEILASIILPAYNEAPAIPRVLNELLMVLNGDHEIIIVDDGSSDKTAAVASQYPCRVLRHTTNMGKGAAVKTGINYARGKYVVVMDADASYPAHSIPQLIELLKDYDMVRGIRQTKQDSMPVINQVGNKIFDFILATVGIDCDDHLSGFYGLHRDDLLDMDLDSDGFDLEAEISIKARTRKLNSTNLPIEYQPRLGEKKLRPWRDGWTILSRILFSILTFNPVLTFIYPGIAIMVLASLGAFYLRDSTIVTPYFGLSIHSFILAAVGLLAGFQIVVFGMAASLYRVETGVNPPNWLVHLSSRLPRLGMGAIGLILVGIAFIENLALFLEWITSGAGDFLATRQLVLNASLIVWGLQLLSASLFLSIFSGRLQKMVSNDSRLDTTSLADLSLSLNNPRK